MSQHIRPHIKRVAVLILTMVAVLACGPHVDHASAANSVQSPPPSAHEVSVKFAEFIDVRVRNGRLTHINGASLPSVDGVLNKYAARGVKPLFTRPESALDDELARAKVNRRDVADLNLFFRIRVASAAEAAQLAIELQALPIVETAYVAPRPAPLPVTPNFETGQGYLNAAPDGIGARGVWPEAGGRGAGITIADVEYNWHIDHEDLPVAADPSKILLNPGESITPLPPDYTHHGTAVLGALIAANNLFGVTGIAADADIRMAPASIDGGYNVADAISRATAVLVPGDVILIEQQTPGANGGCDFSQVGCAPVEFNTAEFAAIQTATSLGIIVVEAAGNGQENLDSPAYLGKFDRNVRDSGAIIVGAGAAPGGFPPARSKLWFSSYGSRVDVQAWGEDVTTTGYGDLFGVDVNTAYTYTFGGTSSASAIVAGSVAIVQSVRLAAGLPVLSSSDMRSLLADTGTAQQDSGAFPASDFEIGPLPDTLAAIATGTLHDDVDRALLASPPYPWQYTQSTVGATLELAEPQPCGVGATVWFAVVPAADGTVSVNTFGSSFDTVLAAYHQDHWMSPPGALNPAPLTCNDDTTGAQSSISFPVEAGHLYYIQAGGAAGDEGTLEIQIDCSPDQCLGPPNDSAAYAFPVLGELPWQHLQYTSGATLEDGEPQPCGAIDTTVWFAITAVESGSISASTEGSNFDTVLAAYEEPGVFSPPGSLDMALLSCNDNTGGPQSSITFETIAGVTYYVQVGGASGDTGTLLLTVTCGGDWDCDGVTDATDNCLADANPLQTNTDATFTGFPGADLFGDACDSDDDSDGCTDEEENGVLITRGGLRNALFPWDFADVPTPALPAGGGKTTFINLQDVNATLSWVGRSTFNGTSPGGQNYLHDNNANGVADGSEYDRTGTGTLSGPPNGAITLADVGVVLGQVGHSCFLPP